MPHPANKPASLVAIELVALYPPRCVELGSYGCKQVGAFVMARTAEVAKGQLSHQAAVGATIVHAEHLDTQCVDGQTLIDNPIQPVGCSYEWLPQEFPQ